MINSPIDEIKSRLDIMDVVQGYIKLQKAGINYRAVCPFHSDKKPSLFVSPTRQLWKCFGCGAGGDIFKFVMQIEGLEFGDALRLLAKRAGVELQKQDLRQQTERRRLYEICELAARFFEKQLEGSKIGLRAREYLLSRGVNQDSIKKWRLGYSPDSWQGLSDFLVGRGYKRSEIINAGLAIKKEKSQERDDSYDRFRGRIMFPIFDLSSQVIGFGGRIFEKSRNEDAGEKAAVGTVSKYMNTPTTALYDKSRVLYGLDKAKVDIKKNNNCILVEGYLDAIMASQAGSANVAAVSGTALTPFQLKILKRYSDELLISFDMDAAGGVATKRGIDLALAEGFNIKVITMEGDKDPADVAARNPQEWEGAIKSAKTILDFYFDAAFAQSDARRPEGKKSISQILLPVIKRVPNKIEQSFWLQKLAVKLEVGEDDVRSELSKIKDFQGFRGQQVYVPESVEPPAVKMTLKKTRRDLLEERIFALMLKKPENIELAEQSDIDNFSAVARQVFALVKEKGFGVLLSDGRTKEVLTAEAADFVNLVAFQSEIEEEELDCCLEFKKCLNEIRKLDIKNKLDKISREIKKAETEGDKEGANKLLEIFNALSKETSKIN